MSERGSGIKKRPHLGQKTKGDSKNSIVNFSFG